jgi:hypothetical protein
MARVRCCGCQVEIDTRTTGVAESVRGWRVVRPQGGANQIALMKGQGRWMCAGCLAVARAGLGELEQGSLF